MSAPIQLDRIPGESELLEKDELPGWRRRPAIVIFFAMAALLLLAQGNRFILTNDEGIPVDAAQRILAGSRPYSDFFGHISPGSYWVQALFFKIMGLTLWAARMPVILEFSLQCALLFWLVARLASERAAVAALLIFGGFQIADPSLLTSQHRWDSAAFALAGICVAIRWTSSKGLFASGALLAAAVWCTPPVALVGAAEFLWLCWTVQRRRLIGMYVAGILAVTAMAAGWMAGDGSLAAFVRQMLWVQHHYSSINVMPYGSVVGGYTRLFEGAAGFESFLRSLFVFWMALPALLPPLTILLWCAVAWRRLAPPDPAILLLWLTGFALVLTVFPRADIVHLQFIAVVPYALTAIALSRLLSGKAGAILAFAVIPFALLFALNNFMGVFAVKSMASPIGRVRVPDSLEPSLAGLLAQVAPGQSMFVYPYMPVHYFLTQTRNPTRYSFLAPGMMSAPEEAETLTALQAHPPQWLLYIHLPDSEFRRVFPNAGPSDGHLPALEAWFDKTYVLSEPAVDIAGYQLYRRIALP